MLTVTLWLTKRASGSIDFCVSNRRIGLFQSSMSIASTWIWARALFVSAEKAYTQGWVGLFWFTVPNILCLIFFAGYAAKMRGRFPNGLTRTHVMLFREIDYSFDIAAGVQLGGSVAAVDTIKDDPEDIGVTVGKPFVSKYHTIKRGSLGGACEAMTGMAQ